MTRFVSQQYYNLANPNLVDQLVHLDASKPETKETTNRLRKLLWDLQPPFFDIPDALSGADERMYKALDALETARKKSKQANALLVELWKHSLQGDGIFWPRSFGATVEIVQGAPIGSEKRKIVLVCPGDAIATVNGVVMSLRVERGSDSHNIFADVNKNPSLFDCGGSTLTAEKLLAEEGTVRLGLSEKAFRELVPASELGIGEGKIDATIVLYSQYTLGEIK